MSSKAKLDRIRFADIASLESGRFSFIKDDTLRINIAIYVQYITFLLSLESEYDVGTLTYSIYKDVIFHTAHVIESLLNHKLKELIESGKIIEADIMGAETKHTKDVILYSINQNTQLVACHRRNDSKKLTDDTDFIRLNRAAVKCGLLTKPLFGDCDAVRIMRNKIHLAGLEKVDDAYSQKDINKVFAIATKVIDRVRDFQPSDP